MVEPFFGSVSPNWAGSPPPTFGWFQIPSSFGTRSIGGMSGISMSPQLTQPASPQSFGLGMAPAPGLSIANALPEAYMHGVSVNPFAFGGSPIVTAPALLAAVAMRRGQPTGPANDQEVEDFLYDALELLTGTNEVEVRCDGGRVTLTGNVSHKRLKRDVGEIAWSIPTINDVQNNMIVSTRRRSRSSNREVEQHPSVSRKQA
jgi:BON domain